MDRFEIQDDASVPNGLFAHSGTRQGEGERAYQRFVENPDHPGSRSKLIRSAEPIYSVRVTRDYGALGLRETTR
jgi:hypothetical protein